MFFFFKQLQSTDAKTFWKLYKVITRKESSIPLLCRSDTDLELISDDLEKANILNNSIFQNFNHTSTNTSTTFVFKDLDPSTFPEGLLCSEEKVCSLITSRDVSKSTGSYGISAKMLKSTAPYIVCSGPTMSHTRATADRYYQHHTETTSRQGYNLLGQIIKVPEVPTKKRLHFTAHSQESF